MPAPAWHILLRLRDEVLSIGPAPWLPPQARFFEAGHIQEENVRRSRRRKALQTPHLSLLLRRSVPSCTTIERDPLMRVCRRERVLGSVRRQPVRLANRE